VAMSTEHGEVGRGGAELTGCGGQCSPRMMNGHATAPPPTGGREAPPPLSGGRRRLLQAMIRAVAVVLQAVAATRGGRAAVSAMARVSGQRRCVWCGPARCG
jgi:hypothetical protein